MLWNSNSLRYFSNIVMIVIYCCRVRTISIECTTQSGSTNIQNILPNPKILNHKFTINSNHIIIRSIINIPNSLRNTNSYSCIILIHAVKSSWIRIIKWRGKSSIAISWIKCYDITWGVDVECSYVLVRV